MSVTAHEGSTERAPRRARLHRRRPGALAAARRTTSSTALRKALQDAKDGWYEVEADDGAVLVDLAQVVYLRVESGEHRVGF